MDMDTTRGKHGHEEILEAFRMTGSRYFDRNTDDCERT